MGQCNSTNGLTGTKHSKKIEPNLDLANKVAKKMIVANYEDAETLQKSFSIFKNPTKIKIRSSDSPWRERFTALSVDATNLLYIDDRLVIPNRLQGPIKIPLHWGHPGCDQMLRQIEDIWWP